MEHSESSNPEHSSAGEQPGNLPPFEPQDLPNPTRRLLEDRARRLLPADERPPSPTFDEFMPEVPQARAWYTLRRSENARYTGRWDEVDDLLENVDESVLATQELLGPDQRREREVQLEDADHRVCSLEETDTWIREAQKKLDEQERATQPPTASAVRPGQRLPTRQPTTQSGTVPGSNLSQKRPRDESGPVYHQSSPARQKSNHVLDDLQQSTRFGTPQIHDGSRLSTSATGSGFVGPNFHSADVRPRQTPPTDTGRSFVINPVFRNAAPSERRTWGVGLGRRSGYEISARTTTDTSRQQGSDMAGTSQGFRNTTIPPEENFADLSGSDLARPPNDSPANPQDDDISIQQRDPITTTPTSARGRGRGRGRGSRSRSKQPLVITPLDRFVRFKDDAGNVRILPITTLPVDVAQAMNDKLDLIFHVHLEFACRITKPENQQRNVDTPHCVAHLMIAKKLTGRPPDPDYMCSACSAAPRVCVRMERHPEVASNSTILVFYPRDPSSTPPETTWTDLGYWM
jgi:hypothetical protein